MWTVCTRALLLFQRLQLPQLCHYVSFYFFSPCAWVLPCLFQRCPLMEREVTAFREILEEVGVISTWMLRAPSLLLLFSAAPCSDDLMALPTWGQEKHAWTNFAASDDGEFHRRWPVALSQWRTELAFWQVINWPNMFLLLLSLHSTTGPLLVCCTTSELPQQLVWTQRCVELT